MKHSIIFLTLIYLTLPLAAMEPTDQSIIDLSPQQFSWCELESLKNNQTIRISQDESILEIKPVNYIQLAKAWPYRFQLWSRNTLCSRIKKIKEEFINTGLERLGTCSTYVIQNDGYGYNTYTFQLFCTLLDETDDFEFLKVGIENTEIRNIHSSEQLNSNRHRERLSPSSLRRLLFTPPHVIHHTIPIKDKGINTEEWENSVGTYDLCHQLLPLYQFINHEKKSVAIFSPTHDLKSGSTPLQQSQCGKLSIGEALKAIHEHYIFQKSPFTVFIPIAQSNEGRKHWTLLLLEKQECDIWSATHLDSKGITSRYYSLEPVKQALKSINCAAMNCQYLNHQSIVNNIDCGRFVIRYIQLIYQGIKPQYLSQSEIMKDFDLL